MSQLSVKNEYRNQIDQRRSVPRPGTAAGGHREERRSRPSVDVSIVIPVCERYDNVREVYNAYKTDLEKTNYAYEIVYVLDGGYADVLAELRTLLDKGEPLKIIRFARAFGESTALTAGFANSDGPILVTLPAYHQVEQGAVVRLLDAMADNDMVVGRRWPRTDSGFNRAQTRLFYRIQKLITGYELHDLGCSVRGFKRRVVDEVSIYGDQHRFLPIIAQRWGFKVKELDLPQSPKDSYRRMYRPGVYLRRLLDLLTVFFLNKFTKKPLRFFGLIGSGLAFIGAAILVWLTIERVFFSVGLADRPVLLAGALLVVVGIQIFGLGLLGELIIFTHAKDLKEYTVEEVIN